MKARWILLLALLALPGAAQATTTITGNLRDLGTIPVGTNAFIRFTLKGCPNQPTVPGVAILAPTNGMNWYKDYVADSAGNISGTIYSTRDAAGTGNGDIQCGTSFTSVWYGMSLWVSGKSGPEIPVHAKNGTVLDVGTVTPLTTNPVVTSPNGDSTYARLDAGNQPFLASITAPRIISGAHVTTSANPASSGVLRLASSDGVSWRNNANSADVSFNKDAEDAIYFGAASLVNMLSVSTAVSTASTNTVSNQNLSSYAFNAGQLNAVGKTFRVTASGNFASFVNSTETVALQIIFAGSANVLPFQFVPVAISSSEWVITATCSVQTAGASGVLTCSSHGEASNAAPAVFPWSATNLAANLTTAETLQFEVSFATASTSNVCHQFHLVVEQLQ